MPITRVIRSGGNTIIVEAHAEVTLMPQGHLGRWAAVFTERLEKYTHDFAPARGKGRPRWSHEGQRLRSSFDSAVNYSPSRHRIDMAVGSSADHALYVNDGTGIYNGGAPWRAKILPPWKRGEGSLYESTWIPPGSRRRVKPVWIKGQPGQDFMGKGMARAISSMRMRSYQLPDDPRMAAARATAPRTLTAFLGGTPNNGSFRANLEQWREWRDKAWNSGRELGNRDARAGRRTAKRNARRAAELKRLRASLSTPEDRERQRRDLDERQRQRRAENARRYRERVKSRVNRKPDRSLSQQRAVERRAVEARLRKQFRKVDFQGFEKGQWVFSVRDPKTGLFRILRVTPKSTAKGRRR